MAYISVRDVPHFYEWVRSEPAKEKPVMVFLHGWGGSSRYWQETAEALSPFFDCLLYDFRGFGRSPLPDNRPSISTDECRKAYALETYADDLAILLDQLQLGPVYINAHSTGASIAVLFANRFPSKVQKVILTCNGIFEYDERAFSQFHRFGTYVVKFRPKWMASIPGLPRLFMARFLHQSVPREQRHGFLVDFLAASEPAALGTMLTAVSLEAAQDMPQEFAQLKVPTLLVSGEFDQIIPAAMGQQAAELSPQIDYVLIPNTGHFPMLEASQVYLDKVAKFLKIPLASTTPAIAR